nr:hypothetical protein [Chamaesiphon minutus]
MPSPTIATTCCSRTCKVLIVWAFRSGQTWAKILVILTRSATDYPIVISLSAIVPSIGAVIVSLIDTSRLS